MFVKGQRIGCWESWWWEGQVTLVMHGQGHNFWTKLLENVLESSGKFLFVFILVATPRIYETAKSEGFGELKAARRGCCFFFLWGMETRTKRRQMFCGPICQVGKYVRGCLLMMWFRCHVARIFIMYWTNTDRKSGYLEAVEHVLFWILQNVTTKSYRPE